MGDSMRLLAVPLLALSLLGSACPAEEIVVFADSHSAASEGVVGRDLQWGGLAVCHGQGGFQAWRFHATHAGPYTLRAYYASQDSRAVEVFMNGSLVNGAALAEPTGSYLPESLTWVEVGSVDLVAGENELRIATDGYMPHLAGWVLSDDSEAWDPHVFDERFPDQAELVTRLVAPLKDRMAANRLSLRARFGIDEILFIKRFTYDANHYYTEYINATWKPGGGLYALSLADGSVRCVAPVLESGVVARFDLSFDARRVLLDWKTGPDEGYRIYEVGLDGDGLHRILGPPSDEQDLIATYRNAYHHGTDDMHPCYLPNGDIAFVSTRCQTSSLCDGSDAFTTTNLYRMDREGGGLTRLTHSALSEATPTLMPDGRILYTRWEYVDKGAVSAKCLWAVRPDGTGSVEVYGNNLRLPPTLTQGRVVPDQPNLVLALGTPHYPQNALGTVLAIDTSRSPRSEDPVRFLTPEVKILAEWGWDFLTGNGDERVQDSLGQGPLFRDPYPLPGGYVLVAHKPEGFGGSYAYNGYGLYLLAPDGALEPLYHDPAISSWQPVPIRPRPVAPELESPIDPSLADQGLARCVVTDVYTGMEGVERGTVRFLRVLEQVARPWSARRTEGLFVDEYDQQHAAVSKDTALGLKVLHGIVPVEPDGSAHFLVPANTNVFFQALDEDYMAVQTERTYVNYMPGETRSCVGCHETPEVASPQLSAATPLALMREPSVLLPQPGDAVPHRPLHYPTDVQPVWDRHCVDCHGANQPAGGLDLTGTPTRMFSASYEGLLTERRGARAERIEPDLVPTIGENHPKVGNVSYLPPRSLGSHNSVLMALLTGGRIRLEGVDRRARVERLLAAHAGIELSADELVRVATWVDTNAQYYGSYFGHRNLEFAEEPDFRPVPTWESARGERPNAPGV